MSVINVVHSSTRQLSPNGAAAPPLLSTTFVIFHWLHRNWYWYRRGRTYLNPNNFLNLTSGHMLNYLVGRNRFVRLAAQCVLIAYCILECVEQQAALNRAYGKWIDALGGRYPRVVKHTWEPHETFTLLSPSTSYRIFVTLHDSEHYVREVGYRTAILGNRFFTTSMATIDAVNAFSLNADSDQAVNEVFVNGNRCLDALAENREELVGKLKRNRAVIDSILKTIHAPYGTDKFIEHVDKTMGKTQTASALLAKVNKTVGVTLTETLKYLFFGFMTTFGLSSVVPDRFVPCRGIFEESREGKTVYGRFAEVRRRNAGIHPLPETPTKVLTPIKKPYTPMQASIAETRRKMREAEELKKAQAAAKVEKAGDEAHVT